MPNYLAVSLEVFNALVGANVRLSPLRQVIAREGGAGRRC